MNAPQIIMICLMAIGFGVGMANHGKPETGKKSFWVTLFSLAINFSLLWWGGFWR